ncbi:MAG: amino acid-binding protein [Lachnospiraceae bacterium]|nr:amino acid-binding protein [Lachnospiraceae bacterium]MBR3684392.1 amino acid-binding protein [Lachnospiraceae bacterium]
MSVKQISVFIENKKGKLAEATRYIADNNVNMKALSIADTQDFGILRIICEDPKAAEEALKEGGFITTVTDVLAVAISDKPGSLAAILEVLAEANIVVEYTYAFLSAKAGAYMIFRVDDNQSAAAALAGAGIKTANQEELF